MAAHHMKDDDDDDLDVSDTEDPELEVSAETGFGWEKHFSSCFNSLFICLQ
jgi:hypothetical protein